MNRFARVCCPIDFSEQSAAALEVAAELASRLDAILTIVHVRDTIARPLPDTPQALDAARAEGEARARLEGARKTVEARSSCRVGTILLAGDPVWEVAKLLSDGEYDLAVMGTHGRSGLKRLLVGSVTARVLKYASCPVLVVPSMATIAQPSDEPARGQGTPA
jgi:nucleotide-binding universal stress UspA family protein